MNSSKLLGPDPEDATELVTCKHMNSPKEIKWATQRFALKHWHTKNLTS